MKLTNWMNRLFILPLLMGVLLSAASGQNQNKAQPQDAELAHRIVSTSANIKPSDAVAVSGGKHTASLVMAVRNTLLCPASLRFRRA